MGMSTHIQAFIPDTDPIYQKHRKVLIACSEADVSLPEETAKYFGSKYPDTCLLEEKLSVNLVEDKHYKEYQTEGASGYEVELKDLPAGVTKIRIYNSW